MDANWSAKRLEAWAQRLVAETNDLADTIDPDRALSPKKPLRHTFAAQLDAIGRMANKLQWEAHVYDHIINHNETMAR